MTKYADMHTHTVYSDGTYSPEELLKKASSSGLCCIAICDHDVVDAIRPAMEIAEKYGIEVISGIELSADIEQGEVHILGYLFDYKDKSLNSRLKELKHARIKRIFRICERLHALGVDVNAEDILKLAGPGSAGRLHIARFLLQKGYIASTAEAFRRYIGDKGPAYVNQFRISPPEAIKLIIDTGGVPVLAHPYTLPDEDMIEEFVNAGIKGIEVFYPEHTPSMVEKYKAIASRFNLVITGGSDFHGKAKEVGLGSVKVPYEFVQRLKDAK